MYSLADYARMLASDTRREAYMAALRAVVGPGKTVLDLGAGTGFFALYAASLGAKHVVAVDHNPALAVARRAAHANGFSQRMTFLDARIEDAKLPEVVRDGVDVIVSDLRGMLPLNQRALQATQRAKEEWLAPRGVLIPASDVLCIAGVESAAAYERLVRVFSGASMGVTFDCSLGRTHAVNDAYQDRGHGSWIPTGGLVTDVAEWGVVVHGAPPPPRFDATVTLTVQRACTVHGYAVWFVAKLFGAHGFSTAPGTDMPYGRAFLPLESPLPLAAGNSVEVRISALAGSEDHTLSWQTRAPRDGGRDPNDEITFAQSTLFSAPLP